MKQEDIHKCLGCA